MQLTSLLADPLVTVVTFYLLLLVTTSVSASGSVVRWMRSARVGVKHLEISRFILA